MINKILKYIVLISFGILLIGVFGSFIENEYSSKVVVYSYSVFILASIFLILGNGDFVKTIEFKLSLIGFPIVIIGSLFKIMHWPSNDFIIGIGYSILILFYIIYLVHFKKSHWIYAVKLLFLICFLSAKFLAIIHYPFAREIEITSFSLLIFLVCLYFIQNRKLSKK